MISKKKRARLDELDALLRTSGVDVEAVAKQWGVLPGRVTDYLNYLKIHNGRIEWRESSNGRLYYYAEVLQSGSQEDRTNNSR